MHRFPWILRTIAWLGLMKKCSEPYITQHEKGEKKELVTHEDSLHTMVCLLKEKMKPFARHLFVFHWQYMQFKRLLTSLPQITSLIVCDFAENFSTNIRKDFNQHTGNTTRLWFIQWCAVTTARTVRRWSLNT